MSLTFSLLNTIFRFLISVQPDGEGGNDSDYDEWLGYADIYKFYTMQGINK